MAVTVQEEINTVCVFDHFGIGPGAAFRFISKMGHDDDVLGAFCPGVVYCFLNCVVYTFSGSILEEAVDKVSVFILEIFRRGGSKGFRGGYADETDLYAVKFLDDIGIEHQLAFFVEVAADVGEFGLFGQFQEAVHAVVKLVVSGNGDIIADRVHQVDVCFA